MKESSHPLNGIALRYLLIVFSVRDIPQYWTVTFQILFFMNIVIVFKEPYSYFIEKLYRHQPLG
jgi:hypothetical protein